VWGGSHLLYKDTYTRFSGHGRDKHFSALLNVIGLYIFHFNIISVRGWISYDTTSGQSNKRKMVDVIETHTICVFDLVSLSLSFRFLLFNIHQHLDLKLDPISFLSGDNSHNCLHSKKIQCNN
jgi:hypothetical protein